MKENLKKENRRQREKKGELARDKVLGETKTRKGNGGEENRRNKREEGREVIEGTERSLRGRPFSTSYRGGGVEALATMARPPVCVEVVLSRRWFGDAVGYSPRPAFLPLLILRCGKFLL